MTIRESAEDYLEAMLMLKEEHGYIRSVDVAEKMGVTKPSVSYATKRLRESGYITLDQAGMIVLLDPGRKIAERIYFSIQTPGFLELIPDSELFIMFSNGFTARFEFKGNVDIGRIGRMISEFVLA